MAHADPRPKADPGGRLERPVAVLSDTTRKTYRYLRVSVVAMVVLLAISLALEITRPGGASFGSISGYYYSPVRSVFVGALVAIGPALIAIKGRPGWEDTLLDLAGMLIPLVAFVPTLRELPPGGCGDGGDRCVPPELVPAVANNVRSLFLLGAVGIAFAWWSAGRRGRNDPAVTAGLVAATLVWLGFWAWFEVGEASFLRGAHYAAAIPFFLLIALFAILSGRSAGRRARTPGMPPSRYSAAYQTIGGLMAAAVAGAAVLYGASFLFRFELPFTTLFWVEAVVLVLFVAFWTLQTAENWNEEAVEAPVVAPGRV
jgi:hypothetical protein